MLEPEAGGVGALAAGERGGGAARGGAEDGVPPGRARPAPALVRLAEPDPLILCQRGAEKPLSR